MKKEILLLSAILISISVQSIFAQHPAPSKGNFIWHWHLNNAPDLHVYARAKDLKMKGIFLHIGEFFHCDGNPQFQLLQFHTHSFEKLIENKSLELHLTFTFSAISQSTFLKYFDKHTEDATSYIVDTIDSILNIFNCKKIRVDGIQLDMEGKIDLSKYKSLIDSVRERFGEDYLISIAIPTYWYRKKDFTPLIKSADFIVPMLYDYAKDRYVSGMVRVTDTKWIEDWVSKTDKLEVPFYAGIPTYSYSVIYDKKGKRSVSWAKSSPEDLSQNPDFELIKSKRAIVRGADEYNGDNVYIFKAKRDTYLENYELKKGSKVKIDFVTPYGITRYMGASKKSEAKNLLGVAFFRYGYAREELVVGYRDISRAIEKRDMPAPKPEVEILFDSQGHIPMQIGDVIKIGVILKNRGESPSFCTSNNNKVILEIVNGNPVKSYRGAFEEIESKDKKITLKEYLLADGELIMSGGIYIKVEELPLVLNCHAEITDIEGKNKIQSKTKILMISENGIETRSTR